MNNWLEKNINLGDIEVGKTVLVTFEYTGDLDSIHNLKSSCGCAVPVYSRKNKKITVQYKPGKVPYHLSNTQNYYFIEKFIDVIYDDGSIDKLSFKATVHEK